MERAWINYWVDIGILISFIVAGFTGILKMPGLLPFLGISYTSLNLQLISWLHDWFGVAMVLMALAHVALHWNWIILMTKRLWRNDK